MQCVFGVTRFTIWLNKYLCKGHSKKKDDNFLQPEMGRDKLADILNYINPK